MLSTDELYQIELLTSFSVCDASSKMSKSPDSSLSESFGASDTSLKMLRLSHCQLTSMRDFVSSYNLLPLWSSLWEVQWELSILSMQIFSQIHMLIRQFMRSLLCRLFRTWLRSCGWMARFLYEIMRLVTLLKLFSRVVNIQKRYRSTSMWGVMALAVITSQRCGPVMYKTSS